MRLPSTPQASVSRRKIVEYLLAQGHPHGRHKAAFFARFGYDAAHWEVLAEALRRHAAEHDVDKREETPFGIRYTVEGVLSTPDHRNPLVRSVWFVEFDETLPKLVTAYPLDRRQA
jgi:hypothetical protein